MSLNRHSRSDERIHDGRERVDDERRENPGEQAQRPAPDRAGLLCRDSAGERRLEQPGVVIAISLGPWDAGLSSEESEKLTVRTQVGRGQAAVPTASPGSTLSWDMPARHVRPAEMSDPRTKRANLH